ncbi:efflux RND transporter permease subunit [Parachryseolinea silvisoli]|uniref:efflux RND transporter permease subunit n=1 Tax=Parachryseolinea silvisoli TaxID=2873601 RepID=UPI002265AAF0|nr:efflux RND transporter permease subunit [Parachryseolinea silvisoli]MCD9016772.1 MMPL family transporter [Parachryseolinea silvisoli]
MWNRIARFIIQYRLPLIIVIGLLTVVMGYYASRVEMSYDFARTVPLSDPDMIYFNKFKEQFGEDGNVIAVGVKDSNVYKLKNFEAFRTLSADIKKIEGVNEVLSLPVMKMIVKDTAAQRFTLLPVFSEKLSSQADLDTALAVARNQKVYMDRIVNTRNGAAMMLVWVQKEVMNSSRREALAQSLQDAGKRFVDNTGIELHYAGLPFIRTLVANEVKREMAFFLYASAIVTGLIMFLFFRSFRAVLFSMIIIGIVVVWTLGTLSLFGFKITLLSGLIPPVIVTIGITNAIYLLNKYHLEFVKTNNKLEAITTVVQKMGLATFLTNLTVAIGFLTLLSTDILILREFGIVAGINIMVLFLVSLVMIPSVFSWLPTPSEKHLRHLNFRIMGDFLKGIDAVVHRRRPLVYMVSMALAIFSAYGMMQLRSVSYMVDDIPEESQIKKDLHFFEANFTGVMPLEIVVEFKTKKRRPVLDVKNLQKLEEFENFLDSLPEVSRPVSVLSLIKASKQAFYNGNPDRYALPSKSEGAFILRYMKGQVDPSAGGQGSGDGKGLFKSFVDSTFTKVRMSSQIADVGSIRMDSLVHDVIEPRMRAIFVSTEKDSVVATVTGSTKIFIKGNKFLVDNLRESLLLAFILITLSMAIMFANVRMIVISLVPNLLALMITAGLMGYFNIPLKASTALIFSITFGISVDNSIRFLAKYRQEILANNFFIPVAVTDAILETGKSIMYTSIVLFAGFIIFTFSSFGGTIALGLLTSVTLIISMFTNLILLPALILTFDRPKKKKGEHLPIDDFDASFYGESEDEEIDLNKIQIHNRHSAAE